MPRIIYPLGSADIHFLFSGAPQFFVRSEGHHTGAPHPSVAFPWDERLSIRDLQDHDQIEDEAWSCATAWPHVTVRRHEKVEEHAAGAHDIHSDLYHITNQDYECPRASDGEEGHQKLRAHFIPRCQEKPNMLSSQGLERGTIGFQAALELDISDALEEDEGASTYAHLAAHRSQHLGKEKHGIRLLEESALISQLINVGETYHDGPNMRELPTVESYTRLFTQLLFPPTRVTDDEDPYSLHVQIEALTKILARPRIWVDFSLVEWRIRLGQILWAPSGDLDGEDEISINGDVVHEPSQEKYWLLLQILLSCELLLRLDSAAKKADEHTSFLKPGEVHSFDKQATTGLKWSLLLARLWLENVNLKRGEPEAAPGQKPTGWLASLTGFSPSRPQQQARDTLSSLEYLPRHQGRQLSGLLHFAKDLAWPNIDNIASSLAGARGDGTAPTTPAPATPMSTTTQRSSYFGTPTRRPGIKRGLSRQVTLQRISAVVHPSGWLSRSYLSGLVLPGEGLSHFLISTLLENDNAAVARLGEEANLYGGFVYEGRSFWSVACVVGRVLAAGPGARECMGWVSSDELPKGIEDGWVNVEVEVAGLEGEGRAYEEARIWKKKEVEAESHVLGDADPASILPGDFTLPADLLPDTTHSGIVLNSLELLSIDETVSTPIGGHPPSLSDESEVPVIHSYTPSMRFAIHHGTYT